MRFRKLFPVSLLIAVLITAFAFSQDGRIVEKMPKSKNFDIPEDLPGDIKELLRECEKEMDLRMEDVKNFQEHQENFLKAAKKAVQKAPDCALAHFYLCVAYQGDDNDKLALKEIEKGLKANPGFYEMDVEKADILVRDEKEDEALKLYNKVIEEHPDYYYTYEAKFSLMVKQKKWPEALEMLNKVLANPHLESTDKNLKEFKPILESEVKGLNMPNKAEGTHYVVETDAGQDYAEEILKHAETIYKAYDKVFSGKMKPGEKFPISIFSNAQDYHNYGGPPNTGGFFHPALQRVVFIKARTDGTFTTTLYHELFHQFLASQEVVQPIWFNEGHADFFGGYTFDEENNRMLPGPNQMRVNSIRQAVQQGAVVPLAQLLTMTREEYYEPKRASINYAQGWSFVYFLWMAEGGKYNKYVKNYYGYMKKKKYSLKEMYAKVFASDIGELEASWRAFVARGCR